MAKKANEGNPAKKTSKAEAKPKEKAIAKTKATAKPAKATDVPKLVKRLTKQQVVEIVGEINNLAIETVERGMLAIGLLVLEKVFQGIVEAALSRNPYKTKTLQQVCASADLRVDRRRLGEWVRAAALSKDLIAKGVECPNLGYSHFAALLQVKNAEQRQKLAAKANEERWTARKLIDEVNQLKFFSAAKNKAQKPDKSSDEQADKMLEIMGHPLALMQDEETKKTLSSPEDMRHKVTESMVAYLAGRIDDLIASMEGYTALLRLAKKNMRIITLERLQADDDEVIDVQANVV